MQEKTFPHALIFDMTNLQFKNYDKSPGTLLHHLTDNFPFKPLLILKIMIYGLKAIKTKRKKPLIVIY